MAKVQQISEITPSFAFTEYDFYKNYEDSFQKSELGRIHRMLPLHEMAVRFGLIDTHRRKKAGRKSYFSPEGKVALMFLKEIDGVSFIEKLSFNAFNEGTRLVHSVKLAEKLFREKITKLGGDSSYSGNENRSFCSERGIETSFSQKGRKREASASVSAVKRELARVRATAMEGSFGTQKEHYSLKRINGRIKKTEILIIFFGIHTANAVLLAKRMAEKKQSLVA